MGTFHRTNITPEGIIKGAARLLIAPPSQSWPTELSDIIVLASGATQYDAASGWTDLGATRTGINIARNNTEESDDVDQIATDIASSPTGWEMSVGTAIAEVTLEHIALLWEGGSISTDVSPPTGEEKHLPLGAPESYTQRRLAVLFQRPKQADGSPGKIRAYVFRKVQRTPQDSSFTHARQGELITIPVRWRCLADDTVNDVNARFGEIIDQSPDA